MTYLQMLLPAAWMLSVWQIFRIRRAAGRTGRWTDFAGPAAVLLATWPVAAWLFAATLERPFPPSLVPARDADAIVVLGANAYLANASQAETQPGDDTYRRLEHAAWLFAHWKRLPIVVSGGRVSGGAATLAGLMRGELLRTGVPGEMILVEDRSSSTYENAVNTAALLRARGLRRAALVTEGFHLLRSELCFRKQGIDVVPAGCCYRTQEPHSPLGFLLPGIWGLTVNEECVHEWGGLLWYKLAGRI